MQHWLSSSRLSLGLAVHLALLPQLPPTPCSLGARGRLTGACHPPLLASHTAGPAGDAHYKDGVFAAGALVSG